MMWPERFYSVRLVEENWLNINAKGGLAPNKIRTNYTSLHPMRKDVNHGGEISLTASMNQEG